MERDRNIAEAIVGECLQLGEGLFLRGAVNDQPEVARIELLVIFPDEAGVKKLFEPVGFPDCMIGDDGVSDARFSFDDCDKAFHVLFFVVVELIDDTKLRRRRTGIV